VLLYTTEPEAVREVSRDVFGWASTPPRHRPAAAPRPTCSRSMCDDIEVAAAELRDRGLPVSEPRDEGYGVTTMVGLPGGLEIQLYRPRHPTAI
jgi:hypothetical protein